MDPGVAMIGPTSEFQPMRPSLADERRRRNIQGPTTSIDRRPNMQAHLRGQRHGWMIVKRRTATAMMLSLNRYEEESTLSAAREGPALEGPLTMSTHWMNEAHVRR
jgi:hypothetical protein